MNEQRLKICDLCGALNLMENRECHVCGWRGHFSAEPQRVRRLLHLAYRLQHSAQSESAGWRWRLQEVWLRVCSWYTRLRTSGRFPFRYDSR